MNKTVKYGLNGALFVGGANAILNVFKQLNDLQPGQKFDWRQFLVALGKGAALGGTIGVVAGAYRDEKMKKLLNEAGGVAGVIHNALENYTDTDDSLIKKAEQLQRKLLWKFGKLLSQHPCIKGSHDRGTAILGSDMDIQVTFVKSAGTLEAIREMVEQYLSEEFSDSRLLRIRNQNWSIGLFFKFNGEEKRIDIVPLREIENGKGDTFLYSMKKQTIKKTNSTKQSVNFKTTPKQKRIIKLLKGWKQDNGINIPSIYLELLVIRAFNETIIPRGIEKALLAVLYYIGRRITTIRIVDPANTNNIISNCLTTSEKEQIGDFCLEMVEEIEKDKKNILDYFSLTD